MNNANLLSQAFLQRQPKAAAALLQEFPAEQVVVFLQQMPCAVLAPVFDSMASWPAARTLSQMPEQLTADILRALPPAEAETLLRLMSHEQRRAVLKYMPNSIAKSFTQKLAYPVSTVGAWMDTSIPYFSADSSVDDCLDLVKRKKSYLGGVVIVVDERRHLLGLVEVEKLLTSDGKQQLSTLLNKDIQAIAARTTLWEIENHEGWTQFPALPVIDRNNIILGALTHSALKAGTMKPEDQPGEVLKFSLVVHLSKALFVVLGGLLQVVLGSRDNNSYQRLQPMKQQLKHAKEISDEQ